ncbi:hypothetical protein NQ318_006338 [Aromia moschata]|uniref:Uncharacterized protein n=1 Tax=Aromia moschata TaxID=1265417 RepID=A0AAV8XYV8_9CUCU|nr:hypothetical protein NQ318_006338 [Aromia moschata]
MAIGLPIYYFSVRPYKEAQNNKVFNKNSIDPTVSMVNTPTQNGKLNGVNNIAFVADDISEKKDSAFVIKESQKRPAPQPPTSVNDIEIPPEITKLDEILEEVSNSIDRKLSIGTVSNVSDVVSREENVIAVVHRDNVITPANSNAPPSPTDSKQKFSTDIGTISSLGTKNDTQNINFSNSEIVSDKIAENETQKEALNKLLNGQQAVNFPLPPELFSSISLEDSDKITENETQKEVLTKLPDQQETVKSSLPPEPFSSNSLEDTMDSDKNKAGNETSAVSSTETVSSIVTPPPLSKYSVTF